MGLARYCRLLALAAVIQFASAEDDAAKTCVDPAAHNELKDRLSTSNAELQKLNPLLESTKSQLEKCKADAISQEQLDKLRKDIGTLEQVIKEGETKNANLQKEKADVLNEKAAVLNEKAAVLNENNKFRESYLSCQADQADAKVLMSKHLLWQHVERLHGFSVLVYDHFVNLNPIKTHLQWFSDARKEIVVELQVKLGPHMSALERKWGKVKVMISPHIEKVTVIYQKSIAPHLAVIRGHAVEAGAMIGDQARQFAQTLNDKVSDSLQTLYKQHPELKAYIPEGGVDRSLCAGYVLLVVYFCLRLLKKCLSHLLRLVRWFISTFVCCGCLGCLRRKQPRDAPTKKPKEAKHKDGRSGLKKD